MLYVGIDPGRTTGAIVCLSADGKLLEKVLLKDLIIVDKLLQVNLKALQQYAYKLKDLKARVCIENPGPDPRWGVKSAWSFAEHIGTLKAMFPEAHHVRPTVWQAKITRKIPAKDPKERARIAAKARWPREEWYPSSRHVKPHNGLIDAALIAAYGLEHVDFKIKVEPEDILF